jgi:N-acetylmuramoyl-L-alanine amidase
MGDFRKLVESFLSVQSRYLVRVTTDVLNVRKDAGTSHNVVTTVKINEVYTIVEEKVVGNDVWGKLLSGAGWICLTYTNKL